MGFLGLVLLGASFWSDDWVSEHTTMHRWRECDAHNPSYAAPLVIAILMLALDALLLGLLPAAAGGRLRATLFWALHRC